MSFKGGKAPLFAWPLGQGVAADLEHAGNAAQGGAFLVSSQHLLLEGLGVATLIGGVDEGAFAVFAAQALRGLGRCAVPDDVGAVTIGTPDFD